MRKHALIGLFVTLIAASGALAATGQTTKLRTATLAQAVARTADVRRQRYTVDLKIVRRAMPLVVHAQSAVAPGTVSVHLELGDVTLPDGTIIPGSETWGLIDGPFLYEHAPTGDAVGSVQWLRVPIDSLSPGQPALRGMHGMTAMPLFHVLDEAHAHRLAPNASSFGGSVAYDDPVVATALQPLSAGLQFRDLHVTAWIGPGGLVRRVRLTGRTADHSARLLLVAHLYAFGRPVHVTPPAEGTFSDRKLTQLSD